MVLSVFKRLLVVLTLFAFLGAGFGQVKLTLQTTAVQDEMSAMMMADGSHAMPMSAPRKGKAAGCCGNMGCVFMLALFTPSTLHGTVLPWSRVTYPMSAGTRPGRSVEPAIGPPIRAA